MNIDWFTFGAQIFNFLILVALLRWFLYRPVVEAMQRREDRIQQRLQQAEDQQQEAGKQKQHWIEKNEELDQQRDERLAKAEQDAERRRKELLEIARQEIERKQQQWQQELQRQRDSLLAALRRRTTHQALATARRVLEELADEHLQQRIVAHFLKQIQSLGEPQAEELREAMSSESVATVRSAMELPESYRKEIRQAIRDALETDVDLRFETAPEVICGIELEAASHVVGWSVDHFLQSLDEQLSEMLSAQVATTSRQGEPRGGDGTPSDGEDRDPEATVEAPGSSSNGGTDDSNKEDPSGDRPRKRDRE